MVYEVISPRGRGTGNIVGVHTESPQCIDSLDMQKAMVAGGSKITFEGTEEEYEAVKDKLHPKTKALYLLLAKTDCRTTSISIGSARCQSCASGQFRSRTVSMLGSVSAFISAQLKPVKTSLNTQFAVSTGHMLTA